MSGPLRFRGRPRQAARSSSRSGICICNALILGISLLRSGISIRDDRRPLSTPEMRGIDRLLPWHLPAGRCPFLGLPLICTGRERTRYPSAVLASSGHRRQRAAHAAHQDVDAIDHVRPLGGVAERAQ